MVGEEGGVTGGPEDKGRDERVAQEAGTEERGRGGGEEGQRIEDVADPEAVGDGVGEDREERWMG